MLPISLETKQEILELDAIVDKLRKLLSICNTELAVRRLGQEIASQTQEKMSKEQRDYVLREQLRTIEEQLGEKDPERAAARELRKGLRSSTSREEVRREVERELVALERLAAASPEYGMIRTYIEWIVSLPWQKEPGAPSTWRRRAAVLDEDHYDLEQIKDRIVDHWP